MASGSRNVALEDLLAHAGWLSQLARQLVRGDVADDAAQQTWLAAIRSPPDPDLPPRPWLARVLLNFIRQRARADGRRSLHEAESDASTRSEVEATDALYERVALQRLIAEQVMDLDEPYRRVVLLRYYEGRSAAEIARYLGIPAGTVRWRLTEALRRLRGELDRRQGRDAWRTLFAPISASNVAFPAEGLIIMAKGKLVISGMILVVGLVGGGVIWWASGTHVPAPTGSGNSDLRDPVETAAAAPVAARPGSEASSPPPAPGRPLPRFVTSPPNVSEGDRAVSAGALAKEEVRATMRTTIPEVKRCFEALLEKEPNAGGLLVIRFVIAERDGVGRVSEATVVPQDRDAGAPELIAPLTEQCILNALVSTPFPIPTGGPVTISYPFVLTPGRRRPDGGRLGSLD
jgi:RNA polymerase sigma factor (sigma-70 family)